MMQFRRARLASLDVDGTAVTPAAVPILKNIILANRPDGFVTVAGNKWDARAMAHAAKELGTPVKPPKVDKIF